MMDVPNRNRPKLTLPRSPLEKVLEVVGVLLLLFMVGLLLVSWPSVPETIPTHFNAAGQPDNYGGKGSLVVVPIVALVLYALLTVVSFFPQVFNFPWRITEQNAEAQYRLARTLLTWLKVELLATMTYILWMQTQAALNHLPGLGFWFLPVALVVIFGTIGWGIRLMYRAR
jgi:uncharacterized membrane protein